MYNIILLLHLLGATLWTGGHLVLALAIMPAALRNREPRLILEFETAYEKIGMAALAVQILTGFMLAFRLVPDISHWLSGHDPASRLISIKLILLVMTIILAVHARLRIIPRLDVRNLHVLAWHISAITVLSVLFVAAGTAFRSGGIF